jgi:hypothetical protein
MIGMPLSFANLLSVRRWDVDSGRMGMIIQIPLRGFFSGHSKPHCLSGFWTAGTLISIPSFSRGLHPMRMASKAI